MALATTTISGLISGLDTATIIQQLMAIEKRPLNKLQQQVDLANQQKSAFTRINTTLLALKTAADDLSRADTWDAKTATVSNQSVLSATVTSATPAGAYSFRVTQLAAAGQLVSGGYADASAALGITGSFNLTVGTDTQNIAVDAADTLNDVAAAVNAKNMGVSAVVVDTGQVAGRYRLILTSAQTGTANAVSFTDVDSGLAFSELTAAKNSIIEFGATAPIQIESATNTVTGLAPGLTLDLKAESAAPVTVTVATDSTGLLQKAQDFVTKYNAVVDSLATYDSYDADKLQASVLFGNSTLRNLEMSLPMAISDAVAGQPEETNSLAMVGFKLDSKGKLSLDEAVFSAALQAHPEGVTELFSAITEAGEQVGVAHRVSNMLDFVTRAVDGDIATEQSSLDTRITDLQKNMDDMQARLDAKQEQLQREFTAMESALAQMQAQSQQFLAQLGSTSSSK